MSEEISSLLSLEKTIENSDSSIDDDYEMLKAIYPDDIKEIKNNSDELYFLLKLKHEIEIQSSTIELLHSMKLDDLLNCTNDNCMYLPYWIKILYLKENKIIKFSIYIFWFKYEENIKNELNEKLSGNIDEPLLYNSIEETKAIVENSLKDKTMLIDILTEIRDLMALKVHTTPDNFLLIETGANDDLDEDFQYDETKQRNPSNNNKHKNNDKENKKENKSLKKGADKKQDNTNEGENDENEKNKDYNYEKFFEDGGFVGDTIIDRASTFQAHAIKIKNKKEVDFYRKCLLSQKKIKKATHNIIIYRYFDKEKNIIVEDYDDDGEHEAGFKLLGIVQKMKIMNLFVMVTRWYGGTLLHQDRFKRINDCAQILLNQHPDVFESNNK